LLYKVITNKHKINIDKYSKICYNLIPYNKKDFIIMKSSIKFFTILFSIILINACGSEKKESSSESTLLSEASLGSILQETNKSTEEVPEETTEETVTEATPIEPETVSNDIENIVLTDKQYFLVKSPTSCTINNQNKFVYDVLHDSYFWSEEVPLLDYTSDNYDSPEKLLEEIKSGNDKFSFIIDAQVSQSYFEEGKNDNFGFSLTLANFDNQSYALVVKYVYPKSPASSKNIHKGDIITKINSNVITEDNLDEIIDMLENDKSISFTFWNNNITNIKSITKKSYDIQTILYSNSYTKESHRVGYVVFQDFIDTAESDLDNLFSQFKAYGANDLILDLRYNGGGSTKLANHLASLIGGSNVYNHTFESILFNEKYTPYNFRTQFESYSKNALNLNRVFVLTTNSTCSASELIINALRSSSNDIEVIQIGDKTCGKPYGFVNAGIFCDKALYSINYTSVNGDEDGDYSEGLIPNCKIDENIFKDFGDQEEILLSEALNYITTDACSAKQNSQKESKVTKLKDITLPENGFRRIMNAY